LYRLIRRAEAALNRRDVIQANCPLLSKESSNGQDLRIFLLLGQQLHFMDTVRPPPCMSLSHPHRQSSAGQPLQRPRHDAQFGSTLTVDLDLKFRLLMSRSMSTSRIPEVFSVGMDLSRILADFLQIRPSSVR